MLGINVKKSGKICQYNDVLPREADPNKVCLEKMQQRVVKQVSGLICVTNEDILQELGLPTLEERRHQADMCMEHKIMQGKGDLQPGLRCRKTISGQRALEQIQ
jgi:hypothetical protein